MAIFDYMRGNKISTDLFSETLKLMLYTHHNFDDGFSQGYFKHGVTWGLPLTLLEGIFGSTTSQGIFQKLPWNPDREAETDQILDDLGWRVIKPEELKYHGNVNSQNTYSGERLDYQSDQVEILGKFDDAGNLIKINVSFRGFGGPRESVITDVITDVAMQFYRTTLGLLNPDYTHEAANNAFGDLLSHVADFAKESGLNGEDVVVSGYSLGGLIANSMAYLSKTKWDGFFDSASYFTIGSPIHFDGDGEKVFNVGFENDFIFRILKNFKLTSDSFGIHDENNSNTTDNITSFDDQYSLLNILPFSLINPLFMLTHFINQCGYSDLFRLMDSKYYDLTHQDSTVIIANLSSKLIEKTWVQDFGYASGNERVGSSFIIGSDGNDKIWGSKGNDYLDGGAGDDTFRDRGGYNIIDGGDGLNTFDLQSRIDNVEFAYNYWTNTFFMRDADGGISIMRNVQQFTAKESWISWLGWDKNVNYTVTKDGLACGGKVINYQNAYLCPIDNSGSNTTFDNDAFQATSKWLIIAPRETSETIHCSEFNKIIVSSEYNDSINLNHQGAFDDGKTILFEDNFGHDTIYDFNENDQLVFMATGESSYGNSYRDYVSFAENGKDTIINFGDNSVTLIGVAPEQLNEHQIVMA